MEKLKNVLKKIKELIDSFTKPLEPEKGFEELAVSAGIGEADLNALKESMGGVSWKFDEEIEETKKGRKPKVAPKESPVQQIQPKVEENVTQPRRTGGREIDE